MSSSNSGCNVIVKLTQNKDTNVDLKKGNEFLPKPQKYENFEKIKNMKKEYSESGLSSTPSTLSSEDDSEKMKLNSRHSLPHNHQGNGGNGRNLKRVTSMPEGSCPPPPPPPFPASNVRQEDEPRGAEVVEVVEEPTVRPSDVVKGMCRSISAICKPLFCFSSLWSLLHRKILYYLNNIIIVYSTNQLMLPKLACNKFRSIILRKKQISSVVVTA